MSDEIVKYSNQFNNQALRKFTALDLDLLMAIASRVRDKGTDEVAFTFEELKRLAENERKQAEKQAEPDMEETWDLSDPADPLNIGMGWGTGGHGLGL